MLFGSHESEREKLSREIEGEMGKLKGVWYFVYKERMDGHVGGVNFGKGVGYGMERFIFMGAKEKGTPRFYQLLL